MADPELTNQLLELLVTMKTILTSTNNSPAGIDQVRAIIGNHPQLAYGLIKTMVSLNIVDQDAFQTTLAASLGQQAPPQAAPPPIMAPQPVSNYGGVPSNSFPPYQSQQPPPHQYSGPPPNQPNPSYPPSRPPYASQQPPQQASKPSRFGPSQAAQPPPVARQPPQQPIPAPYPPPPISRGPPPLPAAAMHLPPDQKEVVMRVLALTPAQIQALPPTERDTFMAIHGRSSIPSFMPKVTNTRKDQSQRYPPAALKRKLDLNSSEGSAAEEDEREGSDVAEGMMLEDSEDGSEDDMDGEKARAAAWEDDEDVEGLSEEESDGDEDEEVDEATKMASFARGIGSFHIAERFVWSSEGYKITRSFSSYSKEMSSLPLGTLLQAAQAASRENEVEESEDDSDDDNSPSSDGSESEKPERGAITGTASDDEDDDDDGPPLEFKLAADRKKVEKRTHKHAPTAITSKRPVSRYRQIVEPTKIDRRDPRFSALSGELSAEKYAKSYGFINELQVQEAKTLRENIRTMRKELQQQQHQRNTNTTTEIPTLSLRQMERTEKEINQLQRNLKRVESLIQRSKQNARERDVLKKLKREENEKRAAGKKDWYLKDSEKKKILLRAKFDDLAKEGGQRMITTVLEKKQKKIAQQEKKARPYARGEFYRSDGDGGASEERYAGGGDGRRKGRSEPRREGRPWKGNDDRHSGRAQKKTRLS
ncbi:rRNA biogenesis protein rrp36 [Tulasnella sp. 330]|nr:rRNA biogenesis protein rrp36 [Tulasnella sp. 330]